MRTFRDIVTAVVYCYITTEFHYPKRDSGLLAFERLAAYSNSQRKTDQIAQIRHSEQQKRQYTTTEVLLHLFGALT